MQDHYCKNLRPDGTCAKTGLLCEDALPSNQLQPQVPDWLSTNPLNTIPPACRGCSNHPSNGGSGICFCTLGGMQFTASTSSGTDIQYTMNINIAEE